jgi:hypothetical protein
VYSICFPIELALQHSIHICNTQEHFLGFRLGLVKAVHLAIHHLPDRQMELADSKMLKISSKANVLRTFKSIASTRF